MYLLEMVHIKFSVQEQKSSNSHLDRREIELYQNHCVTASVKTNTLIEYSVTEQSFHKLACKGFYCSSACQGDDVTLQSLSFNLCIYIRQITCAYYTITNPSGL